MADNQQDGAAEGVFVKFRGAAVDGQQTLDAIASAFGEVADSSKIIAKRRYAEVRFKEESALKAALEAGEVTVGDVTLKLDPLKPRESRPKAARPGPAAAGSSIYVNQLPAEFDKTELRELFSQFGEIRSLEAKKQRPKGADGPLSTHVFITYKEKADAEKAIASAQETPLSLNGATLNVELRKSKEDKGRKADANGTANGSKNGKQGAQERKVYLSHLSHSLTEAEIRAPFEQIGVVTKLTVNQRDSFASVTFKTKEDMDKVIAVAKETPFKLEGVELVVEAWQSLRTKRDEKLARTLHVSGFGEKAPTDAQLHEMFSLHGAIDTVNIRPIRKFALVEFETSESAATAVEKAKADGLGLPAEGEETLTVELSSHNRRGARRNTGRGRKGGKQADVAGAAASAPTIIA